MPRLTDARKELRRTQIAEAALCCFGRRGLERTSIADITAESGLSAGSIYAHYRNKADLVQATATVVLARRAEVLRGYAASAAPPDPDELLARLVAEINPVEARFVVQIWGEATTDPALGAIVGDMVGRLRGLVHDCVVAWLAKAGQHEPERARELAAPLARRVAALYLAELLAVALRGPIEEDLS
ncbi:AcrR family transcriptional regulator [Crossiella equi]|uniref:AcrR family transcriptional regulator n=1 Tax=Crossiella equi TaxID=130796 RepID=A0ABS5A6K3_9PSEU|nr:TetR family transcriptional regulator [Crossiella equi]MBP2472222.1 AcrR family transcriptional regulator [Crossiella equi]